MAQTDKTAAPENSRGAPNVVTELPFMKPWPPKQITRDYEIRDGSVYLVRQTVLY